MRKVGLDALPLLAATALAACAGAPADPPWEPCSPGDPCSRGSCNRGWCVEVELRAPGESEFGCYEGNFFVPAEALTSPVELPLDLRVVLDGLELPVPSDVARPRYEFGVPAPCAGVAEGEHELRVRAVLDEDVVTSAPITATFDFTPPALLGTTPAVPGPIERQAPPQPTLARLHYSEPVVKLGCPGLVRTSSAPEGRPLVCYGTLGAYPDGSDAVVRFELGASDTWVEVQLPFVTDALGNQSEPATVRWDVVAP